MDLLPCPVGSQANPTCGPKLLVSDVGLRKIKPTAGSFAIAFSACFPSSRGTPDHSYRNPRLTVSRGSTFQSSWTNQQTAGLLFAELAVPAPRSAPFAPSGTKSLMSELSEA